MNTITSRFRQTTKDAGMTAPSSGITPKEVLMDKPSKTRRSWMIRLTSSIVLTAMLTTASVVSGSQSAQAAVDKTIVGWNLQGASHSTENKWNTGVANLMVGGVDIVALQEAGAVPKAARLIQSHAVGTFTVQEYQWGGTRSRPAYWIYWLQTDPNGNRVNLALVTRRRADDIFIGTPNVGRPTLGIAYDDDRTIYTTVHALANGGTNADATWDEINTNVPGQVRRFGYERVAVGDWNRDPSTLHPATAVNSYTPGPTYPSTNPTSRFDYALVNPLQGLTMVATLLSIYLSDHIAVQYKYHRP
jgi:Endonuclease/Exonuclease/phosphatase family